MFWEETWHAAYTVKVMWQYNTFFTSASNLNLMSYASIFGKTTVTTGLNSALFAAYGILLASEITRFTKSELILETVDQLLSNHLGSSMLTSLAAFW